jgi:VWFA-related protein
MRHRLSAAIRALVVAAAVVPAGASIGADDAIPSRPVRLDVIATDARGRIVDNLTSADFDVREDGAVRSIDDARFIRTGKAAAADPLIAIESDADERAEATRPNTRLVAVFLDDYHVSAANSAVVRTALLRFVEEYLAPRDLLVVMRPLDSLFTIRLTRDRDRNRKAILDFSGRQGDYMPRNNYERNYIAGAPARIEQLRAQVTTSALNALALHVGNLDSDARKTLIIVSESLPSADRRRGLEGLPTIDTVARSANRYNVSVYVVDPREERANIPATGPAEADALRSLAASTNGQSILNVSDLVEAMRPIASDASAYYLLRYKTAWTDGKFHDVQVRVKKPGVSVRTRKGYWALPSDDDVRAALLRPRAPVVLEPARHTSPFIRPWFGASRGAQGQTHVTFVWEPAGRVPGAKQPVAAHVVLKALAADGKPLFEGSVLPTGPLGPDVLNESRARAEFDAPPGNLRLRMSIEDETEQAIDSDVRDINVRDLSAPVALGTPAVFRGRTARDFLALESMPDAAPVSSREFSRTERLKIRVPVYAPPDVPVTVAAKLLNRKGQPMRNLVAQPLAARLTVSEIDLPLAGFAAGEYRIEIVARTAAAVTTDVLELRITN